MPGATRNGVENQTALRASVNAAVRANVSIYSVSAVGLEAFPLVMNGRIAKKGEVDYYRFDAHAGETLSFEAFSGFSAFDPSITIPDHNGRPQFVLDNRTPLAGL